MLISFGYKEDTVVADAVNRVIGIDIGGTSVKAAVVEQDGSVLDEIRLDTDASRGRDWVLSRVSEAVEGLKRSLGDPSNSISGGIGIDALGIATAGRVNVESGEVVYATDNLPGWQGTHLITWARENLALRAVADNDANAALLGEAWQGAGRGKQRLVMLTLGTGVGGAYMEHGLLCRGAHWSGGDWGHSLLFPKGLPCNCGKNGCAEQYVSGNALLRRGREYTDKQYRSGIEIMKEAAHGHLEALQVLDDYTADLAMLLVNISVTLDPEAIIVGGGVADAGEVWWPLLEKHLQQLGVQTEVNRALLGNRAGIIGAARLAFELTDS
ncbi:transcriptional regulator [Paenibacillus terrae]|uniref:Transcriptional regulator n=1 Tax=Paenibacillus terrae TaxID=159743 RepID=A0A4U2Q5W6_9BACL|nr:ROK family protein [Paenibacillus terrae]TKH45234.1 transcriptional regulator [Paenibacillus terrae]